MSRRLTPQVEQLIRHNLEATELWTRISGQKPEYAPSMEIKMLINEIDYLRREIGGRSRKMRGIIWVAPGFFGALIGWCVHYGNYGVAIFNFCIYLGVLTSNSKEG